MERGHLISIGRAESIKHTPHYPLSILTAHIRKDKGKFCRAVTYDRIKVPQLFDEGICNQYEG